MIGGLVQQQGIGLPDPRAGEQGQPLPAAAKRPDRPAGQFLRSAELVQDGPHAPCFPLPLGRRQGLAEQFLKGQGEQCRRHLLLDEAEVGASRDHDAASIRLDLAGDAAQQGRFASAVACNEANAIAGTEAYCQVLEQGAGHDHAEVTQADEGHETIRPDAGREGKRVQQGQSGTTASQLRRACPAMKPIAGREQVPWGGAGYMRASSPPPAWKWNDHDRRSFGW